MAASTAPRTIGGVLTAMVTPFDADGRLAEDAAARLMRHLLSEGSDGLVLAATTGESPTLSDDEKVALWEIGVSESGEAPVIAGTGANDTAHTIELTERAAQVGVDAALVVTPYYNKPNRRGIVAHFRAVAQATELPIVVYNIPARCVVDISNDLLRELAELPTIAAVKQARYENLEPIEGLDLLAGNDDSFARVLDVGGTGGILVASHVVGREMRRMIDEPAARGEIHESLKPLFDALTVTTNPIPIKTALRILGYEVGGFRLPMVDASPDEEAEIRVALERQGLLSRV
jgi:4-hydroxy-tetrahydrodipicolinate synthase